MEIYPSSQAQSSDARPAMPLPLAGRVDFQYTWNSLAVISEDTFTYEDTGLLTTFPSREQEQEC